MNRRTISVLVALAVLMTTALSTGTVGATGKKRPVIGMVLAGPRNDQGFYQVLYEGLKRAARKYKAEPLVLDLVDSSEAPDAIRNLASQDADLIIALNEHEDALIQVAEEFPDVTFLNYGGPTRSKNVGVYAINESQGAYYLGVNAALLDHEVLGWTTSIPIPQFVTDLAAFEAGVASVNPDAEVLTAVTGDFNDPAKVKEAVLAQQRQGATLVAGVWGGNVTGLVQAVEETPDLKAVSNSVDRCGEAPGWQLLWNLNAGEVIYLAVRDFAKGKFNVKKVKSIGLENPKVSDSTICDGTPSDIADELSEVKKGLISGDIEVPHPQQPDA